MAVTTVPIPGDTVPDVADRFTAGLELAAEKLEAVWPMASETVNVVESSRHGTTKVACPDSGVGPVLDAGAGAGHTGATSEAALGDTAIVWAGGGAAEVTISVTVICGVFVPAGPKIEKEIVYVPGESGSRMLAGASLTVRVTGVVAPAPIPEGGTIAANCGVGGLVGSGFAEIPIVVAPALLVTITVWFGGMFPLLLT